MDGSHKLGNQLTEEIIDRLIYIVKQSDETAKEVLDKCQDRSIEFAFNEGLNLGERYLSLWILQSLRIPYNDRPKTAEDMGIEMTKNFKKR